jgi:hypothetical protein
MAVNGGRPEIKPDQAAAEIWPKITLPELAPVTETVRRSRAWPLIITEHDVSVTFRFSTRYQQYVDNYHPPASGFGWRDAPPLVLPARSFSH